MIDSEKRKQVLEFIKEKGEVDDLACLSAAKLTPAERDEILSELEKDGKIKIKRKVFDTVTYIG